MLKTLFRWLDLHPGSYWLAAGGATALLGWQVCSSLRKENRFPAVRNGASWTDFFVLFVFLFSWRWPFLLVATQLNPDESQLIAGAITLSHDPVFWRAVDGTTSGPLNFYILAPFAWLGLPLDYFTARLTGLLLIGGALFACQRALSNRFGRGVAWLGVLPAAFFFSTVTYYDLIHYSSELVTVFFTGLAVWLLVADQPGNTRRLYFASFVAGAAVWAKLQAAPISVMLLGWAVWLGMREQRLDAKKRWRRVLKIGAAAFAPTAIVFLLVALTGQMEAMVRRYFLQNLLYVGDARPLPVALREMSILAMKDGRVPLFLGLALIVLLAAIVSFVTRRVRPPALFIAGAMLTLSAFIAVTAPRREFLHYTLLLPIPFSLWLGAVIGGWWKDPPSVRSRWGLAGAWVVVAALPLLVTRCLQPVPDIYGKFADHWRHPRTSASVLVHALARPGDFLGIWGWEPEIYVETGLPQATRDAHSIWSIQPNPQRDYHRACYLDDLRRHQPAVFVDGVGPGAFALENRLTQAHEIFPALAEYIKRNYTLVTDLGSARIYGRNDLESLRTMLPSRIRVLAAQGRLDERERSIGIAPPLTALDGFQRKNITQREVLMLLPPTKLEWLLSGDERSVTLEFGFDPVAYERGHSNGAELRLELRDADGVRRFFSCFLDPAREADARQPQKITIPLPPFASGDHLVLSSDPGPYGDTAWDWVYLASFQFGRTGL